MSEKETRSEKEEPKAQAQEEEPKAEDQEKEAPAEKEEPKAEETETRYENIADLPQTLRDTLPERAQHIYLDAYQEAWDNYTKQMGGQAGREAVAHRDAMTAVQHDYVHDSESGKWRRKGEGPDTAREKGLIERIKDMF